MAFSFSLREPGLPLSAGLHALVFAAGLVAFNEPKPLPDAVEAVAVEVVDENQLREVTKGEASVKTPAPSPRVDRLAEKVEQNAPGQAPRQVNSEPPPKPVEATAKEERKETVAALPPPPRPPEPKRPEPPQQNAPKPVAAKPPPQPAPKAEEEEEDAEEVVRQAARKREEQQRQEQQRQEQRKLAEEQKREEQRKLAEDQRKRDEIKRAEEARRVEEAQKVEEQKRLETERRREVERKLADAKAAEERRKAEDDKRAQEAARKAAEEKRKREADAQQQARNQQALDNARRALLASREAPSNSGNTGQQVSPTPQAGANTATGQRLNPSDRAALVGLIADQIKPCWSIPSSGRPATLPVVRMTLNPDGSLAGQPVLVNTSADPAFNAVAQSGMRAIRQCAPFRIPARYAATHQDWRVVNVRLDPEE